MEKPKLVAQFLGAVVLAGSSPAITTDEPSRPCMSLAAVREEACPPNWAGVLATKTAWCAKPRDRLAQMDVSAASCRGFLRYHHHFFDGGHYYCLYDPSSLELRGYYSFDRKMEAMTHRHEGGEITCGMSAADFEDKECELASCP